MREWLLLITLLLGQHYPNNIGLSHIAMCHETWECSRTIKAFRDSPEIRLGWLAGPTFGERCSCLRKVMHSTKPKILRAHIANGPCLRNRRCGSYEIFAGDTRFHFDLKIRQRNRKILRRFDKWVLRLKRQLELGRGAVTCYISPVLESDFSPDARKVLLERVARIMPQCTPVDSVYGRECIRGVVCEKHGLTPKLKSPCIADIDGALSSRSQKGSFAERYRKCDLAFIWKPSFNCLNKDLRFSDPRSRNCGERR